MSDKLTLNSASVAVVRDIAVALATSGRVITPMEMLALANSFAAIEANKPHLMPIALNDLTQRGQ